MRHLKLVFAISTILISACTNNKATPKNETKNVIHQERKEIDSKKDTLSAVIIDTIKNKSSGNKSRIDRDIVLPHPGKQPSRVYDSTEIREMMKKDSTITWEK